MAAAGVCVKVRPMSIPAWSSEPPIPVMPFASAISCSGAVQLGSAGAVADLPDAEELGEPAPVGRGQRRGDVEEGVREGADDAARVHVGDALLEVSACSWSHS